MTAPHSFAVEVHPGFGRQVVGWPFGRLDVADASLCVRSWPRGRWIRATTIPAAEVGSIVIGKSLTLPTLWITRTSPDARPIVIRRPLGLGAVTTELVLHGYVVEPR